jgi:hypothetical protein
MLSFKISENQKINKTMKIKYKKPNNLIKKKITYCISAYKFHVLKTNRITVNIVPYWNNNHTIILLWVSIS